MTTVKDILTQAQDQLAAAGIDSPDLDARLLTQHVMGWTQTKLLLNLNHLASGDEVKGLQAAIDRRARREPVSRILGHRAFWKSDFKVTPQTLDPRPDSESLIEGALKYVAPAPASILDLGTGTGCLLLSLLIEWPKATGVGLDISDEAVMTARENALNLSPSRRKPGSPDADETPASAGVGDLVERAEFIASDWSGYRPAALFDLVISNPPYISDDEVPTLAPEVSQYDPLRALAAGPEGLDCYHSIAERLNNWLKPGGWALFEIGHTQAEAVKSILALHGMSVLHVLPDLAGSDRVIVARRP